MNIYEYKKIKTQIETYLSQYNFLIHYIFITSKTPSKF